jgi:hypothetical protein
VAPPGNQAANGENKHQPKVSEETGLLDSNKRRSIKDADEGRENGYNNAESRGYGLRRLSKRKP